MVVSVDSWIFEVFNDFCAKLKKGLWGIVKEAIKKVGVTTCVEVLFVDFYVFLDIFWDKLKGVFKGVLDFGPFWALL